MFLPDIAWPQLVGVDVDSVGEQLNEPSTSSSTSV